jgi:O-antigen/teichoic acid export membrane protein
MTQARQYLVDPLYRQSFFLPASTGAAAGTGLLFWVVAAHRQRPDVLGVAAGLVAANSFLSYLTSFALPYAMLRFGGPNRPVSSVLNASLVVSGAASLLAAFAFAAVAPLTTPALAHELRSPADIVLFGLAGVGAAASVLLDNVLAARRKAAVVLVRNGVAGALKLVPLAVPGLDARSLYLAATMPALVTAVAVLLVMPVLVAGYRLRELAVTPAVREVAAFAVRAFPGSLLSGAPQFALPLLAVSVLAASEYAFFYVAWSIAQILYLVPSVVSNITLSEGGSAPVRELVARSRRLCLALVAPACLAGVLLTGVVLGWYGTAYASGAGLALRLMLLAAVPWTIVILAQTRLRIEHRFPALTVLTGVFCLASLVLPVAAAPAFAVPGMAVGWLVAVGLTAGFATWLA